MCACGDPDPSYVCVTHRETRHDPWSDPDRNDPYEADAPPICPRCFKPAEPGHNCRDAEVTELRARLTTAETERSQWEQRAESANRRMDEASAEAMQANLRAAAAEARVGMSPEWRFWEGRAETAGARVEAAEQALADANRWTGRVSGPELHRLYGHTASFDSCTDSMCNFAHKALVAIGDRAALACPPQQPQKAGE